MLLLVFVFFRHLTSTTPTFMSNENEWTHIQEILRANKIWVTFFFCAVWRVQHHNTRLFEDLGKEWTKSKGANNNNNTLLPFNTKIILGRLLSTKRMNQECNLASCIVICRKLQKKFWKEFFSSLLLCAQKWLSLDSFPETKL